MWNECPLLLGNGKSGFGGAEPESLESLNIDSSPVVNIKPEAEGYSENKVGVFSQKIGEKIWREFWDFNRKGNFWWEGKALPLELG